MPVTRTGWELMLSCAFLGAILIALVIAALMQDPMTVSVP